MVSRAKYFRYLLLIPVVYLILQLVIIAIFDPYDYNDRIKKRQKRAKEVEYYRRGDIYDRNGHLLVTTQYHYQLDLDKKLIQRESVEGNHNKIFRLISSTISEITGSNCVSLLDRIKDDRYSSIFLADDLLFIDIKDIKNTIRSAVDADTTYKITKKRLVDALRTTRTSAERIYPFGSLAPRLLGLATPPLSDEKTPDEKNRNMNRFLHLSGACGMEATFDDILKGEDGWREILYDATGGEILKPSLKTRKAENGQDIYLTINIRYQEILEEQLQAGLKKYGAHSAMGVIMDVHSGEILALSGEMETDSEMSVDRLRSFSNLPVSYSIEPGSTMKPITGLLALEQNLYRKDELLDCSTLEMEYADGIRKISDHKEFEDMNLEGIIVHSSNPGISRVAMKIGKTALNDRMIQMGLGRETLSDIYGESKGIFRSANKWSQYSLCSISFGQEISLNMLHLAVIYASIANDGGIIRPQILLESKDSFGNINNELVPQIFRYVSTPEAIGEMQKFLQKVVWEGTGTATQLDYIEIAGKTGTAEVISRDENGRKRTHHNSLFAGYFPADDPQLVMVISYERCKEDVHLYHYGSKSAVPTFKKIVRQMLIIPDCDIVTRTKKNSSDLTILPNLIGLTKKDAEAILKRMDMTYSFINKKKTGIVSDQFPPANIKFERHQPIKLALAEKSEESYEIDQMPDFSGLTLRTAKKLAVNYNINLTTDGNGIVYRQSIKPATKIEPGAICQLYLN